MILDYVVTYPNGGITHWASDMILSAPSDAGCLSKSKARSDAGTHILISENEHVPRLNGAVLTISQMIKLFIYLPAKADLAGYSSPPRLWFPCTKLSSKWDSHNPILLSKPKTPWPPGSQTITLYPNTLIKRTWDCGGSDSTNPKANSDSIGHLKPLTRVIISQKPPPNLSWI